MNPDSGTRSALHVMLQRELRALDREIAAYPDDQSLWLVPPGISNSAGMLVQHICGNLRHFFGAVLANTGYKRDRDAEFGVRDRSRDELRADVQGTIDEVTLTFDRVGDEMLAGSYPVQLAGRSVLAAEFIVHLAVHLAYHVGQIDYHRRLLSEGAVTVDVVSIMELTTAP